MSTFGKFDVCDYLANGDISGNIAIGNKQKSLTSFRLTYLHLNLVHFKGQGRVHFDFEYLANGKR